MSTPAENMQNKIGLELEMGAARVQARGRSSDRGASRARKDDLRPPRRAAPSAGEALVRPSGSEGRARPDRLHQVTRPSTRRGA